VLSVAAIGVSFRHFEQIVSQIPQRAIGMLGMRHERNFQIKQLSKSGLDTAALMPQEQLRPAELRDLLRRQVVVIGD
jgi:hypothetical protein